MKTKTVLFAGMLLAMAATVASCGVGEASDAEIATITTPVPVETALPFRKDIFATYAATASIASDLDAPVTARVAGELVELYVEEGDQVKVGQVLARLDGERLRLEMLSAKANLVRTEKEYRRNIDLHERGIVSTAVFEDLRYDLQSMQASYDLKRLNFDYSNIKAPIAGVISARHIKQGENVSIGQIAFRITETSELIAHLQIPQTELSKFDVGHPANLEVAAIPGERFAATIIRISPTIDVKDGTFRATALIENKDHRLAPGMFARFTISYEKHSNALVIPSNAILDEDDQTAVYVVEDDEVSRRVVVTGVRNDGLVEILTGLNEDDAIVVVGQSGLRDGSKVLASIATSGQNAG